MTGWAQNQIARWCQTLAEYAEEHVRELIEEAKDPEKAQQLTAILQDRCDEIRYGESGAHLDFFPLACCVALGESEFADATDTLFDVGSIESAPALETAATHALQRLGAPALRRLMSLIDGCKDPFSRSFGYTALEGAVDVDDMTRKKVIDFCLRRANIEGRAQKDREWGCWPALSACATLVALEQQQVRPTIEWWIQQDDCDVEQVHWNELLIELDGYAIGPRTCGWREPWPVRCHRLVKELQEEDVYVTKTPTQREGPKVGRNAPCPCGSGRKYKKCCLK